MGIEGQNDILLSISEIAPTGNSRNAEMVCTYLALQRHITLIAFLLRTTLHNNTSC